MKEEFRRITYSIENITCLLSTLTNSLLENSCLSLEANSIEIAKLLEIRAARKLHSVYLAEPNKKEIAIQNARLADEDATKALVGLNFTRKA